MPIERDGDTPADSFQLFLIADGQSAGRAMQLIQHPVVRRLEVVFLTRRVAATVIGLVGLDVLILTGPAVAVRSACRSERDVGRILSASRSAAYLTPGGLKLTSVGVASSGQRQLIVTHGARSRPAAAAADRRRREQSAASFGSHVSLTEARRATSGSR